MKICEDCIKQDVCKYTKQVGKYENDAKLPKPLEPMVACKYKRTEPSYWSYTIPSTTTSGSSAGDHFRLDSGDCTQTASGTLN